MKQGWSVTIEGRADRPLDPEEVLDRLQPHHPAVQGAGPVLAATVTVDADGALNAIDQAHEIVRRAITPARLAIEEIDAKTEERLDRELERSNLPDLVGLAEIAELAGTTRQRVFQMTANKGFPAALLELRSGRLWARPAIERYLQDYRAPRLKTLASQVGGQAVVSMATRKRVAASRRSR